MTKVLIIGAGAAGIMAAISAKRHHPDFEIEVLEKNPVLGKKILVCGAGRCNVTNANISIDRFYGAPSKFISTIINQFNNKDIIKFLNSLGIELYEEEKNGRKKGKIFPTTNQAKTITELLESELQRLGIKISYNSEVKDIRKNGNGFEILINRLGENSTIKSDYIVLACGGKTYPTLGATGFGYEIAEILGHTVIEPVPSALPLEVDHPLIHRATGMRVDAEVTSIIGGKVIKKDTDEMLFTNYGLSGPVILNISREISVRINRERKEDCQLRINFFPGKNTEFVKNLLNERWTSKPDQQILYSLYGILPNKVAQLVLEFLQIDKTNFNQKITKAEKINIAEFLTNWTVDVKATRGWGEGEFTAGGIDTKEVSTTLESKLVPQLYFAGEVLNVDGDVGGFNLSWSWSSGYVAGKLV
ncbi:NAD(P)/FAD-dependent oxidoreductase [Candidatus Dojkabacteria bacterium]|nr:NAD(P)/FAD-dependent oxidoreductase [Candidatus Dojkabacteria bacterium]